MKSVLSLAAIVTFSVISTTNAAILVDESFTNYVEGYYPTVPTAEFNNWYADAPDGWARVIDYSVQGQMRPNETSAYIHIATDTNWLKNTPGTFFNPTFTADVTMDYGEPWPGFAYMMGIFNADNNGYVARVDRNGDMYLYRVDNGIDIGRDAWTLLLRVNEASEPTLSVDAGGEGQLLTFKIIDGQLQFTTNLGGLISIVDATYGTFTTIGFAGFTPSEGIHIRSAVLDAVPEPASLLSLGALSAGTLLLRRRK